MFLRQRALTFSILIASPFALDRSTPSAFALELPPTGISYRIDARLDPETRMLAGSEEIRWTNPTGEPVTSLPLHLYLNAFSNTGTTWMSEEEIDRFERDERLLREKDPWGYMEPTAITQRLGSVEQGSAWRPIQPDDGNPNDRSLAEIELAAPVPPGGEIVLNIAFEGRLPIPIARTGGRRDFFLVAQWFPKIGVIEPAGVRHAQAARSAARQFHAQTEFYADFADYDVSFSAPDGWMVGATGRAVGDATADSTAGYRKFHYAQAAVHDFALVVGKNLTDQWTHYAPQGGGPAVDIRYIVPAGTEAQIPRWRKAAEGTLDQLGARVGPYPYTTLTIVMMPFWAGRTAGMEYPTFITGAPGDPLWDRFPFSRLLVGEGTVVHEVGHQYFYGLLASNEQEEGFLDEGFNSYWENEILRALYGEEASGGSLAGRPLRQSDLFASALASAAAKIREPVRKTPTSMYASGTWGEQTYFHSAVIFLTAARLFGQDRVDGVFAEYFRRFAFRHPDFDDFLQVALDAGGTDLAAFLREAYERETLPDFSVTEVKAQKWKAPLGRVLTKDGPVTIDEKTSEGDSEIGLDDSAREADGRVMMEISDAGWVRGGKSQAGAVTRSFAQPERGEPDAEYKPDGFFESTVSIAGPGWDTLPVAVEFRFADGAIVKDQWDGKSPWRNYQFLRAAPIRDARIDRQDRIAVDVKPQNNALAAEPDNGFSARWAAWFGALSQWFVCGVSLWL